VCVCVCVCVSVPCWLYYWIIQGYMVKVHYKVKMDFAKVGCECLERIHLMQDIALGQALIMKFMLP